MKIKTGSGVLTILDIPNDGRLITGVLSMAHNIDAEINVLVHRWGIARVIAALARWAYHPTSPLPVIESRKLATTARRLNAVYEYLQP